MWNVRWGNVSIKTNPTHDSVIENQTRSYHHQQNGTDGEVGRTLFCSLLPGMLNLRGITQWFGRPTDRGRAETNPTTKELELEKARYSFPIGKDPDSMGYLPKS